MMNPFMKKKLKVGTRTSNLALKQVEEIKKIFSGIEFEIVPILTTGDKDKTTPLDRIEEPDFFTREIDEALLSERIDVAVHSAKDLPEITASGLEIVYESESLSPFDALVSKGNLRLSDLAKFSRIGVSSLRRKEQIRALRDDLKIVNIRGTIEERLSLLDSGKIDALIVAHAALIRLGLENRLSEILPLATFPTHPKQGKLALVVKASNRDIIDLFKMTIHELSR